MILGIDVSGWNPGLDWEKLAAGGVKFAVVKLTQATYSVTNLAEDHITQARKRGILVAGYHWSDPLYNDQMQADFFYKYLDLYDLKAGYVDAEQYWADWSEFYARSVTKFLDPYRISNNAFNVMTALKKKNINAAPYTRRSFIDDRAKPMWGWIKPERSWYAQYPYARGVIYADWNDFKPGGRYWPVISQPWLPDETRWDLWQFSGDKFILPGTGDRPIDLNFFPGTEEELAQWMGGINLPDPEPIEEGEEMINLVVLVNDLRIREAPNALSTTKILGWRKAGTTIKAQEIQVNGSNSVWVLDDRGWSAVVHGGVKYME